MLNMSNVEIFALIVIAIAIFYATWLCYKLDLDTNKRNAKKYMQIIKDDQVAINGLLHEIAVLRAMLATYTSYRQEKNIK